MGVSISAGRATFEWLDGHTFLIWRSHDNHPQVPDAIAIIGWIDDQLLMHYVDYRGVHRIYEVAVEDRQWRYWRDDPGTMRWATSPTRPHRVNGTLCLCPSRSCAHDEGCATWNCCGTPTTTATS